MHAPAFWITCFEFKMLIHLVLWTVCVKLCCPNPMEGEQGTTAVSDPTRQNWDQISELQIFLVCPLIAEIRIFTLCLNNEISSITSWSFLWASPQIFQWFRGWDPQGVVTQDWAEWPGLDLPSPCPRPLLLEFSELSSSVLSLMALPHFCTSLSFLCMFCLGFFFVGFICVWFFCLLVFRWVFL